MASSTTPSTPEFPTGCWVVLDGLQNAAELNGRLGQVFEYLPDKDRYTVFVLPQDLSSDGDALAEATAGDSAAALRSHDALMKQVFPALTDPAWREAQQQHKLLKRNNLLLYEGSMVSAMLVESSRHPPSGEWKQLELPASHPLFRLSSGNSPVFERYGVPLVVARVPCDRSKDRAQYDNQVATYLRINTQNGIAPMTWQSYVGPVVIFRAGGKPFSDLDLEVVWEVITNLIERYGDGPGAVRPDRDLTPLQLEKQVRNYLSADDDWNRVSMNILNDNSEGSPYRGLSMDQREKLLVEHQSKPPGRGLGGRFDSQHLVRREGGLWS